MEPTTTIDLAAGGEPNPVDRTGLCLLSLDGGGVRGLSTLYILKGIMTLLNHERREINLPPVKPCEIFDLIGGTSTGGLIAIMLGRLEMDVDECISAYSDLMESVFNERLRRVPVDLNRKVAPKFDSTKLKEAIEEVVRRKGMRASDLFNDGQARGCRVFVCAAAKELYGITHIRSYDLPRKTNVGATICEAALATSAATGFFNPVNIQGQHFVDGALGANNPVDEVEAEAADIWCPQSADLKPLVKCFLSIGTGNPGKKAIEDNFLKFLSKSLVRITTETEETAKKFMSRWRQHYISKRYFRFNVEQGLQGVGLAEFKEQATIKTATDQYLDDQARVFWVQDCVENIKQKENRTDTSFAAVFQAYDTRVVLRQHDKMEAPRYSIPFSKNTRFAGRTNILENIRGKLFGNTSHRYVAVVGLGGVGKTQVALEIAHWTMDKKPEWSVLWIPALSRASFEQATLEVAQKFGLQENTNEDPKVLVKRYLSSSKSGKWLLIIDNADDEEIIFGTDGMIEGIRDYFPQNYWGRILLTTRSRRIGTRIAGPDVVDISQMSEQEARILLQKALIDKTLLQNDEGVVELLCFLTYLPLAIIQAAAYLNETKESIGEYLRLLKNTENDLVELLSTEFADETRYRNAKNAVATTWVVSFQQIQKDADAANLLSFLAFIEPKAIPRSMLPQAESEQRTTRAIGTLCGYSFLSRRDGEEAFDMHSLVHLASRIWIKSQDDTNEKRTAALRYLRTIFNTSSWETRESWRKYMPHVLGAIHSLKYDDWGANECHLGHWVGECLQMEGRNREAAKLLEHVVAVRRRTLEEEHPHRLASQHALAIVYKANGEVKKAVKLLEHVVAVQGRTLEEEHPHRLASQHALANAYKANGEVKKAVKLLEHVVAVQGRTLEEEHPPQLASQHALASAYIDNGEVKKAVKLLKHVVVVKGRTLEEEHPSRLASQHALASAYIANGEVKKAVKLLEHMVAVKGRTLEEEHPDRLASQQVLAIAYNNNGEVKKAVKLLEHVVAVQGRTLEEEHPHRLASQHALASAYIDNGEVKKAVKLLEYVVAVRRRTLEEEHPHRLASQQVLANAYKANGEVKKAVKLLEHVVAVEGRTLEEEHPDRLASQHALAIAYIANGEVKKAVKLLEHVVAVRRRTLEEEHPHRLASQHALAIVYKAKGEVKKAVKLLEHVVAVEGRTLEEEHPSRLVSQRALASISEANRHSTNVVRPRIRLKSWKWLGYIYEKGGNR